MNIVLGYTASETHVARLTQIAGGARVERVPDERVPEVIASADIFCGHVRAPVDWRRVVTAGQLKWIQSSAAGLDHCLDPAVVESDIQVTSASGLFASAVAELALTLILGLLKRLPRFFQASQRREYRRRPTDDLAGKTIGIVGLGGNGRRIAQVLAGWDVHLLATDLFPVDRPASVHELWPADRLDALLAASDIVVLTVPLTDATRGLITAGRLGMMRRGAYLINVARGQIVDEPSLIAALESGHIAGAGLDVAAIEPLPSTSRLWSLDNVIITPHVGAQSHDRYDRVTEFFAMNLQRYLAGQSLANRVDKRLGFPLPADRWSPD
jgi:D-3-phosphoglycerate dehydrogenase